MKKKIVIIGVTLAFIMVSLYVTQLLRKNSTEQNNSADTKKNNEQSIVQINNYYREDILAYAPQAKEKETFKLSTTDNRRFFARAYSLDGYHKSPGGIIVVDITDRSKPTVFWEIQSPSFVDQVSDFEVRDIPGDGHPELLSKWGVGVRLQGNMLWIFSYDGTTFKLINPVTRGTASDGTRPNVDVTLTDFVNNHGYASAFWGARNRFVDLDKDNISEIQVWYFNEEGEISETSPIKTDTYKWNGAKYYLWKTITEKGKPIPF